MRIGGSEMAKGNGKVGREILVELLQEHREMQGAVEQLAQTVWRLGERVERLEDTVGNSKRPWGSSGKTSSSSIRRSSR